jgi:hypothetical protein
MCEMVADEPVIQNWRGNRLLPTEISGGTGFIFISLGPFDNSVFHQAIILPHKILLLLLCVSKSTLYRVIPSVLDPRKCEYLKDYSLFNLIFCKYILYL